MKLPDEPEGWHRLRAMAKRAPDPHTLALIIEQLNRLLDEHERKTAIRPHDALDEPIRTPQSRWKYKDSKTERSSI